MAECCKVMAEQMIPCANHGLDCMDLVIYKSEQHGYAIKIPGPAGGGMYVIRFCPWCGKKLHE